MKTVRHSSCSLQHKCLPVRSLLTSSSQTSCSIPPSSTVMSAASGGCVVSAIVPCSFQHSREIKVSTSFHGRKHADLVNLFPGTFRLKQTSGFSPCRADNRQFVRRLSARAVDDTKPEEVRETKEELHISPWNDSIQSHGAATEGALPSGDPEFATKRKTPIALPYRVKKRSVLKLNLSGPSEYLLRASEFWTTFSDDQSEIVLHDSSSGDDNLPWIRKGRESVSNFCQLLPASLTHGDTRRFSTLVKLAVVASMAGLQACSLAWAGTEIAKANVDSGFFGSLDDIENGFASSFLLIFFSEIGDKTFFIAALLATRKPGAAVFSGTFGALAVMTVISVALGRAFHYVDELLPSLGETRIAWDDLAAVVLLVYFGVSTLIEAASMEESKQEGEQQEAELAIAGVGANGALAGTVAATFALVFVAEWGDKSFFSTIALAAASSPLGVVTGAIGGHGAATLLAVLGGSFLGNYISEKVIAYVGGALFLVFAGITLVETLS